MVNGASDGSYACEKGKMGGAGNVEHEKPPGKQNKRGSAVVLVAPMSG